MKVYVAGLWENRKHIAEEAELIKRAGHTITSRWLGEDGGLDGMGDETTAMADLEDIDRADVVVSYTLKRGTQFVRGGRHVEFGYGLAKGKKVIVIGDLENIFHNHPKVRQYATTVDWLESWHEDPPPVPHRHIPTSSADRKRFPMARGLIDYFPDALAEVSHISFLGNEKHNPGEPVHWARGKSMDHADCCMRHLTERGTRDVEGVRHSAQLAWRALALLQEELELEEGLSLPRGAWLA